MLKDAVRPGPGNGCMTTGFRAKITKNFFSKKFSTRDMEANPAGPHQLGVGGWAKNAMAHLIAPHLHQEPSSARCLPGGRNYPAPAAYASAALLICVRHHADHNYHSFLETLHFDLGPTVICPAGISPAGSRSTSVDSCSLDLHALAAAEVA